MPHPRSLILTLLTLMPTTLRADLPPVAEDRREIEGDLAHLTRPGALHGFEARSPRGERGLSAILGGQALPSPLPARIHHQVTPARTRTQRWLHEGVLPSPFQGDSDHPVGLGEAVFEDADGVPLITKTCFACHAGTAAGRVIAGLPSSHIDLVPAVEDIDRLLGALDGTGNGPPLEVPPHLDNYVQDFRRYMDRFLLPPFRFARSRGDNLGPYSVWRMMAAIADPERSGILPAAEGDPRIAATQALVDGVALPPVDPMPWWNIRFKDRAYRFWDAPGHAASDFNLNFYVPRSGIDREDHIEAHRESYLEKLDLIEDVLQYARETTPPPLPLREQERMDREVVARGEDIFHGGANSTGRPMRCASCHGRYERSSDGIRVHYPNLGPVDVGTDPSYHEVLKALEPLGERLNRTAGFYPPGRASRSRPTGRRGYVPPVLIGLWASAPYLHNGSVPTLDDLLERPEDRPSIWGRDADHPLEYDLERVGLVHDVLDPARYRELVHGALGREATHPDSLRLRRYYDTSGYGRSNRGHRHGTDLSPEEKRCLREYLESLAPVAGRDRIEPADLRGPGRR